MYTCPKCNSKLVLNEKTYRCVNNHCFDVSKEGYVNLLLKNSTNHGDNKDMVIARRNFLEHDYYKPMADALLAEIKTHPHDVMIDLGCGEGYYTNYLTNELGCTMYANDLSKEAIRLAAKQNKAINYFIASSAELPLPDNSIDVATCIFSYIDFQEYHRILKTDGFLLTVMPASKHLFELKEAIYDTPYLNEEKIPTSEYFELVKQIPVHYEFTLPSTEAIEELFTMTPYYFKTSIKDKAKIKELDSLKVHASFLINVYQNK